MQVELQKPICYKNQVDFYKVQKSSRFLQGTKIKSIFVKSYKNRISFMIVIKTKLIFVVYKNWVNFCKQATKTKSIFSKHATKAESILASNNTNQVGY